MGDNLRATASPQPALVSDQAASRLAPTGFDQAQGRCSHLNHSPLGICTGCREQHQPLLGIPPAELAAMEVDFWNDWNAS